MKMKKLAALLLSLAMVLSLAACGGDDGGQTTDDGSGEGEVITLRASSSTAPDHAYNLGLEKFAELVSEGTNGAVQIDIFPNSALGDERANIEDIDQVDAILELSWAQTTYNAALQVGANVIPQSLMDYLR